MHPAYSIIFFTVSSGMGYGLLIFTCFMVTSSRLVPHDAVGAMLVGTALVIAGLLSSTFHLGHPERAWRAFSQWKTSWLSREGVSAMVSLIASAILIVLYANGRAAAWVSLAVVLLALVTVFCTAMIYASLRPIPRWHHTMVPVLYVLFSLSTGGLLLLTLMTLFSRPSALLTYSMIVIIAITWVCKWIYWRDSDAKGLASSISSATGLDRLLAKSNHSNRAGDKVSVTMMDAPNTSKNYVQKEMGFVIARRHRDKLRRITLLSGMALPIIFLGLSALASLPLQIILVTISMLLTVMAQLLERWLFFAEAQHVVTLFYGE